MEFCWDDDVALLAPPPSSAIVHLRLRKWPWNLLPFLLAYAWRPRCCLVNIPMSHSFSLSIFSPLPLSLCVRNHCATHHSIYIFTLYFLPRGNEYWNIYFNLPLISMGHHHRGCARGNSLCHLPNFQGIADVGTPTTGSRRYEERG